MSKTQEIQNLFLQGLSVHQVARSKKITIARATKIQNDLIEELKQQAIKHRILCRSTIRDAMPTAVNFLRRVVSDPKMGEQLENADGRAKISLQIKAAEKILSASSSALNENLATLLAERPTTEESQPTLFDFESTISDDGGITLEARPKASSE